MKMDTIDNMVNDRLTDYFADYPASAEMTELREELTADLSEAAHERHEKGATMLDAVNDAFDRLGDLDDLVDEISNGEQPEFSADDEQTHQHEGHYEQQGHHIDINDGQVTVDGGSTFTANSDGVFIHDGKTLRIDNHGVDINNGTVSFTEDGVRLGKLVIDENGIRTEEKPNRTSARTDKWHHDEHQNDETFADFDKGFHAADAADTEIHVESLPLANEMAYDAKDIERIDFTYDDANIRVLANPNSDQIIFREYMSRTNASYLGTSTVSDGTLTIRNGRHPHLLPLRIRTQLLIPTSFTGDLRLTSHSGSVRMTNFGTLGQVRVNLHSGSLQINGGHVLDLDVDSHSGSVKFNQFIADGLLRLRVHSGIVRLNTVSVKEFDIQAKSGSIRGDQLTGSGSINASSGTVNLAFSALTGNLDTLAHSGTIKLAFAPDVFYNFDLEAKSGKVSGPAGAIYDHDQMSFKDGAVGEDPHIYVTAAADSGTITVR
ncbi:DUF4097 family beta strand repeat-containing protein [Furfurilactobacillus siliginis]|uniref:DUF4097 domain-containing protein n=2 Tax=Furfurilactobacillus siliginis TaxID=348151 RepID=A0A510VNX0_9LACO|nr:DUF4097 family beta strand repeat-containing protein [Furfurilactobacillus siliginis]GEK28633.1 hypothetical protein LSI01_09440 [Furfurilactobacillus siliginis]